MSRLAAGLVALLIPATGAAHAETPRLSGVLIAGEDRVALLGPAGGAVAPVQEGEAVGGLTLRRILPDRVVLEGQGGTITLELGTPAAAAPVADTGGATFGLVVNPPAPAPD